MASDDQDLISSIDSYRSLQSKLPELIGKVQSLDVKQASKEQVIQYLKSATASQVRECARICVLGKTGSGKTSLLNAILKVDLLPAEDEGFAVTSTVTEMCHDPEMAEGKFRVTTVSATQEEWKVIKEILVDSLHDGLDGDQIDKEELCALARAVFPEVYEDKQPEQVDYETPECESFRQLLQLQPDKCSVQKQFDSVEAARAFLREHVHLKMAKNKKMALVTQCVRVVGHFPDIPQDVVIADLPGLEDTNILRSNVAERYFHLNCTHAWFCLPKSEGLRIRSDAGLRRQVRVLARSNRLSNCVLVRTKGDIVRKKREKLAKEFGDFRKLCNDLQDGLDHSDAVEHHIEVKTAPADDEQKADVEIDDALKILKDIGAAQQTQARELAQVCLQEAERMLGDSIEKTREELQTSIQRWKREVEEFRGHLLRIDPNPGVTAAIKVLDGAGPGYFNTIRAVITHLGRWVIFSSPSSGRSYDLPSDVFGSLRVQVGQRFLGIEMAWATLFVNLHGYMRLSRDASDLAIPRDLLNTVRAKSATARQHINAVLAPRGLVQAVLRKTLVHELPTGKGATDAFLEQSRARLEGQEGEGVPKLLTELDEALGGVAQRLADELLGLIDERFPQQRGQLKRLRRIVASDLCIICKNATAVTRAEFVLCKCHPKNPYACPECAQRIDLQFRKCPICRAAGP